MSLVQDMNVQRAGAMAVASLARLEPNRDKLGALGAAELVLNGFKTHPNQVPTAPAIECCIFARP